MKPHAGSICLFISALLFCVIADLHSPEVHTKLGSLRGEYVNVKGKTTGVHAFLGVPFAKPPVGPLRLTPPRPADAWKGVTDATKQPPMCIQNVDVAFEMVEKFGISAGIPNISEDCLYLNIYTPANKADDAKLPVMVWIYGGGFAVGSASLYDGSAVAAYQDVVVVLIQYRVGLLGFLSTGDEHMPGNYGLLDQVEALRWIKENIHNFGGNPDLVTIFGESAGGVSVSLHLLSPLSDGLFHRAIAESGTAAIRTLVGSDPVPMMQVAVNASGCTFECTKKISECMRNVDVNAIIQLTKNPALIFSVSIDGRFLTKPVSELFGSGKLHAVPFMTGINDHEGGYLMASYFSPPNWKEKMDREHIVNLLSMFFPNPKDSIMKDLILAEYIGNGDDYAKNRDGLTEILGDFIFNIPAVETAKAHRDAGAAVYLYEYHYPPAFLQKARPSFVRCDHADEIFTVLGFCFTTTHVKLREMCTEKEESLSRTMMSYWGNFARTGSPNGDGLVHWPKYGADEEHLSIDLQEQITDRHLKQQQIHFMSKILPEKIRQHEEALQVQTKLGSLRGKYERVKGKSTGVRAFLGVPFAKPPVGALRLSPPQPAQAWDGVRDATKQPPMCIQNVKFLSDLLENFGGLSIEIPDISEDCLYLNIYTPANRAPDAKLPVMMWIHGGGFSIGSASMFDGSALAAYQDVVVVLIQYRLGLLGFLSTGDEHMPGNYGLLDQVEALKWIKENIHNFGGNPDLVTIFGESAGGVSVSLHLMSPLSDGLFHHAIAESGTAAIHTLVGADPLPLLRMAADAAGCKLQSTKEISECMITLDDEILTALAKNLTFGFTVTIDGRFLTKPVRELLGSGKLLPVPFLTGINDHEGGDTLTTHFGPPNWKEGIDREHAVSTLSVFVPNPKDALKKDLILEEYIGTGEDRIRNRDGLTEIIGDFFFGIPLVETANAHRDAGAAVYLYEYHHAPGFLQKMRPSFVRCDHADEIFTVMGFCFTIGNSKFSETCTEEEKDLSRRMMSYWGNFARSGSPNGDGLVHWPSYGSNEEYLSIDLQEQVAAKHLKQQQFHFMTKILPEKVKKHEEELQIRTKLGSLKGEYVWVKGRSTGVHAFLGVPFAKPPVGSLRLSPPQPADPWEGVRDATKQPPMCIQNVEMVQETLKKMDAWVVDLPDISEDCLYLNIYTPANKARDAKLPVMVWIYGGGFALGSASLYDGSALAAYQDVVVVLIQYRLGLLGFFSTGDEHMSGNYGLLDQIEALKWIKENIHNFGGNPDLVTIFGESAGAVSVSLHLLSPLSDGLFHHAIAESGTAAISFLVGVDPIPAMQTIANASGCNLESTKKISECIRNLNIETITTLAKDPNWLFAVNVDGHFLEKPVDELFEKQKVRALPFLTGFNNHEGGWFVADLFAPPNWHEGMDREHFLDFLSQIYTDPADAFLKELIVDEYIGTGEDRVRNRDRFTEMIGDFFFSIPTVKTANAHRDAGAPVYLYEYHYPPSFMRKKRPSFVGSDHGDELFTALGFCFTTTHVTLKDPCSEDDRHLSRIMMKYWGNFARTGTPNGDGLVHWPKYGAGEEYLSVDLKEPVAAQHLKKNQFTFMTEILPEKIRQHKATAGHQEL